MSLSDREHQACLAYQEPEVNQATWVAQDPQEEPWWGLQACQDCRDQRVSVVTLADMVPKVSLNRIIISVITVATIQGL